MTNKIPQKPKPIFQLEFSLTQCHQELHYTTLEAKMSKSPLYSPYYRCEILLIEIYGHKRTPDTEHDTNMNIV